MRFILGIKWEERKTNVEVLEISGLSSTYTLLRQRRLRWLGHVHRMEDGRIPKDLLYGELEMGERARRHLCSDIEQEGYENSGHWRNILGDNCSWQGCLEANPQSVSFPKWKVNGRQQSLKSGPGEKQKQAKMPSIFICSNFGGDCKACIGLLSYSKKCGT